MLRIQLAEEAADKPPLEACSLLLRASCSCARGLPPDSSSWDLSSLLIDGQPVSRETVTAWLNVVYTLLDNKPFEEGQPRRAGRLLGRAGGTVLQGQGWRTGGADESR